MKTHETGQRAGRWFLALAIFGLVLAQTSAADPATSGTPKTPAATAKPKKTEVKTPGEVASQVCVVLANHKTPWQIYQSYAAIFQDYALRQSRVPAATAEAQQLRQRLVAHYQGMAMLLQQMQECAVIRDNIKQNRTEIPFGERQAAYVEAGKRHDLLLQQFIVMGSKLTGFRLVGKPAASQTEAKSGTR